MHVASDYPLFFLLQITTLKVQYFVLIKRGKNIKSDLIKRGKNILIFDPTNWGINNNANI